MESRNHFDEVQALSSAILGFELEFFSSMMKGRMAESISKLVGKKVVVSDSYHSGMTVDRDTFKLEADYSGGSDMVELVTGPMPYEEAIPVLYKLLAWISEHGYTNDRCAFQFSLSFDQMRKDVKTPIQHLDKLKFVLGIDEGLIYENFGSRYGSVYAKSIKRIVPRNRFMILDNIQSIDPGMFKLPNEKYYGVNFTKLKDGYLEFRYLGGRDYEKKPSQIVKVINYSILFLYDILSGRTSGYDTKDLEVLQKMMDQYKRVVRSFSNPDLFFSNFPDIHVMVDLKGWDENIKSYWSSIREKLFDLIVEGGLKSGYFNYDTSIGKFQLKDARLRDSMNVNDVDIVNCDVKRGQLVNCRIYFSEIKSCEVDECELFNENRLIKCRIKNTSVEYTSECDDCYIDSKGKKIAGKFVGGVIRNGNIAESASISKETKIVIVKSKNETGPSLPNSNLEPVKIRRFNNLNF
jgi:hypothetical protein